MKTTANSQLKEATNFDSQLSKLCQSASTCVSTKKLVCQKNPGHFHLNVGFALFNLDPLN